MQCGFRAVFCSDPDNYVRQGRRNLDGYRLWYDVHGESNKTSDLFDASPDSGSQTYRCAPALMRGNIDLKLRMQHNRL